MPVDPRLDTVQVVPPTPFSPDGKRVLPEPLAALSKTTITDAGLAHLKPLFNLDRLFLDKTMVTDAGLEHLKGLTKLRSLRFQGTKVTAKGIRALRAALPGIEDIGR